MTVPISNYGPRKGRGIGSFKELILIVCGKRVHLSVVTTLEIVECAIYFIHPIPFPSFSLLIVRFLLSLM